MLVSSLFAKAELTIGQNKTLHAVMQGLQYHGMVGLAGFEPAAS
jgi:hypothetical protein